jgi:hypothetical protein
MQPFIGLLKIFKTKKDMSYDISDIGKPAAANAGAGGGMNNEIIMVKADDILTMPDRGDDDVTITSDIVMKSGKYMRTIYSTPETIEPSFKKAEGDNKDVTAFEVGLKFQHPGLEKEILQFMAQHPSTKFYMILRNCALSKMYLFGEPCNELIMNEAEGKWGKTVTEGKYLTFNFSVTQSLPIAIYEGNLTLDDSSSSASASASASGV